MATYSKPGVYVEETLSPNIPVPATIAGSVAAFIGVADRGPTAVDASNNVVGVPTLVSSWSDFVNTFSYGSATNTFSGAGVGITQAASAAYVATNPTSTLTVTGAAAAGIVAGMSVSGLGIDPTSVVTSVSTNSVNISRPVTGTVSGNAVFANEPLKLAVKSFFDNNGSQAYILREVNTDAVKSETTLRDSNSSISGTASVTTTTTATATTGVTVLSVSSTTDIYVGMAVSGTNVAATTTVTTIGTNSVTISTNPTGSIASAASIVFSGWVFDGTTRQSQNILNIAGVAGSFTGAVVGNSVAISGVSDASYSFLNENRWVIVDVSATGNLLGLAWTGSVIAPKAQTSGVTFKNVTPSATGTLTIKSKDHGRWGNSVWVGTYPNASAGYFDLHVYYSAVASSAAALTDANRVERFVKLSMDSTDARYVVNNVSSNWITVVDAGSTATGYNDLPAFTGTWSSTVGSANSNPSTGAFIWNSSSFSTSAVQLGLTGTTVQTLAGVAGSNGTTVPSPATKTYPQFDSITTPLIINYPARTDSSTIINPLTAYAASRGDSFVVIDTLNDSVVNTITAVKAYSTNQNYGAVYYPNIVIADPASTTGGTKTIPPGGAVAALYTVTDSTRGVFKAPAGVQTRLTSAVSVYSLTSDEFNRVGGANPNINIIRFVPGSGICIMGARTLNSNYSDVYVPVRRSLNYLASNLKNLTEYAIFEPNDANLWSSLTGVVSGFLDGFWRSGGLMGSTADQAFYIKCDSTVNTPSVIAAGEVRIEVGVALQRPAEFVIIKIGQIDGGAAVTTSI